MKKNNNLGFGTKAIHAGKTKDKQYGALVSPIYQTSTFVFDNCQQGGNRFAGKEDGFIYTRLGNPSSNMLEDKLAALEGSEAAVAFSSGMGAISSVLWTILKAGDHVVADCTLYGCTFALMSEGLPRFGIEVTFADLSDAKALQKALKPNTKAVYVETPANPTLKIIDLKEIAEIAHGYNKDIIVAADNTFATPYLQKPLEFGFDVVVHSATKYLNGHGDVVAGFACGTKELMQNVKMFGLKDMTGAVLGPFEAFLVNRGLKTLELRMERHCENAEKLAAYLNKHTKVKAVYFPGLKDHPNHAIAKKQMSKMGGMVSFEVGGGKEAGVKLMESLELCSLAVSLGDTETLVEQPASMTHATYSKEELAKSGIAEGLIRVSVGVENIEDIIADFEQALALI